MNTLQALTLAVSFVLAALIVGFFGRYSMTPIVDHGSALVAYRLDRLTGQTYYCLIPGKDNTFQNVRCAPIAIQP